MGVAKPPGVFHTSDAFTKAVPKDLMDDVAGQDGWNGFATKGWGGIFVTVTDTQRGMVGAVQQIFTDVEAKLKRFDEKSGTFQPIEIWEPKLPAGKFSHRVPRFDGFPLAPLEWTLVITTSSGKLKTGVVMADAPFRTQAGTGAGGRILPGGTEFKTGDFLVLRQRFMTYMRADCKNPPTGVVDTSVFRLDWGVEWFIDVADESKNSTCTTHVEKVGNDKHACPTPAQNGPLNEVLALPQGRRAISIGVEDFERTLKPK